MIHPIVWASIKAYGVRSRRFTATRVLIQPLFSRDPKLFNSSGDEIDTQAGSVGHRDRSIVRANRLRNRLAEGRALFDDEFEQAKGIGNTREKMEGRGDVQIRREAMVHDRQAPVGRERGDLDGLGKAAAAREVDLNDVDLALTSMSCKNDFRSLSSSPAAMRRLVAALSLA